MNNQLNLELTASSDRLTVLLELRSKCRSCSGIQEKFSECILTELDNYHTLQLHKRVLTAQTTQTVLASHQNAKPRSPVSQYRKIPVRFSNPETKSDTDDPDSKFKFSFRVANLDQSSDWQKSSDECPASDPIKCECQAQASPKQPEQQPQKESESEPISNLFGNIADMLDKIGADGHKPQASKSTDALLTAAIEALGLNCISKANNTPTSVDNSSSKSATSVPAKFSISDVVNNFGTFINEDLEKQ